MKTNPRSIARDYAVQFLYQCEADKLLYFSEPHFLTFCQNFEVPAKIASRTQEYARGTFDKIINIDDLIRDASGKWSLERMHATDRSALRIATYELLESQAPTKVVLNEAIVLAKKYGTEHSGAFVNGLLDTLAKKVRN